MGERIDPNKTKDPASVSGWGDDGHGHEKQDFSDISKHDPKNREFQPGVGHETHRGRADATGGED